MIQVERQIADPLAVEGSVEYHYKPCTVSILSPVSAKAATGYPKHSQRIVAPAPLPGGYSVGVPPDPIPNSAVKPACANGTIAQAMEE
jgi:hypothetical protein